MPDPEVVPRRQLPPRPDPAVQLIQAIHGRDGTRIRRLVEVWVHRRGLDSLHDFWASTLPAALEPEALAWLQVQGLVPWPNAADGFSPSAVLDQALADYADAIGVSEPPPPAPVIAGPAPLQHEPEPSVNAPAVAAEPLPAAVSPSLPPPPEPLLRTAPARARRLVSQARMLLRDCLEEVWEGLAGSSAAGRFEAAEASEAAEAADPAKAPEAAEAAPPHQPEVALPIATTPVAAASSPASPSPSAAVALERLRPRARLTVPRLPRATRPAPAPADLADLRMWLPDPIEDLPRAC